MTEPARGHDIAADLKAAAAAANENSCYDVVAAFVARLAQLGAGHVVISPGSRSTALALCFHAHPGFETWIQLDERSAGFFALGLARSTGMPAVLVCTSGTAAANYHPAVVEAHHAAVPLIACTADRPPELRGWGSPQTIDQAGLYGSACRWAVDLPVASSLSIDRALALAETAMAEATGVEPGPVHLNWPFREPLEPGGPVPVAALRAAGPEGRVAASLTDLAAPDDPVPDDLVPDDLVPDDLVPDDLAPGDSISSAAGLAPGESPAARPEVTESFDELAGLVDLVREHERGVVVVGPWPGAGLVQEQRWADSVLGFAAWAGWPVIAEPITQLRGAARGACLVTTIEHLLAGESLPPDQPMSPGELLSPGESAKGESSPSRVRAEPCFGDEMRPDVAVLVGRTVTSKLLRDWLEQTEPNHVVLIDPEDRRQSAVFRLTEHLRVPVTALEYCSMADPVTPRAEWSSRWQRADAGARRALSLDIEQGPLLSALVARTLFACLPSGSLVVASNSLAVRDLDSYVSETGGVLCAANRGASGIDGMASTALGLAAADPARVVALYTGDLALLHDLGGLSAAARLGLHLVVLCVDNDGGEIFSLLPVADRIDRNDFETLFRTRHGACFEDLDGFSGIRVEQVTTLEQLQGALTATTGSRAPGVDLLVVPVDQAGDVAQRRALTAAAGRAAAIS